MINVIATVETRPGKRGEFLREFHQIIPDVLAEDGCIEYGPTVDVVTEIGAQNDPRDHVVVIIEKWESLEALEKHLIAPHMLAYRKRVGDLVEQSSIQVLEPT